MCAVGLDRRELIWKFTDVTNFKFACLIPSHREAGKLGIIMHDDLAAHEVN